MTGFEKMCSVCTLKGKICDKNTMEDCWLITNRTDKDIIDRLRSEVKEDQYPLCDRCIHYHNCCSSLFGDCWTCAVGNKKAADVCDNDWYESIGEPLHECQEYVFGIPLNRCIG